ncbi:hypothetical protein A2U01_0106598, partial [Trifolium medium]|nr:hypothetical protein [Trifolium medium]
APGSSYQIGDVLAGDEGGRLSPIHR